VTRGSSRGFPAWAAIPVDDHVEQFEHLDARRRSEFIEDRSQREADTEPADQHALGCVAGAFGQREFREGLLKSGTPIVLTSLADRNRLSSLPIMQRVNFGLITRPETSSTAR